LDFDKLCEFTSQLFNLRKTIFPIFFPAKAFFKKKTISNKLKAPVPPANQPNQPSPPPPPPQALPPASIEPSPSPPPSAPPPTQTPTTPTPTQPQQTPTRNPTITMTTTSR